MDKPDKGLSGAAGKLYTVDHVADIITDLKRDGKTIGLITGCFDLVHIGHVTLFQFAKANCDFVAIGLESDASLRLSKGEQRPLFGFEQRAHFLSELASVDYIFPVGGAVKFGTPESDALHEAITARLKPSHLILTPATDRHWERKVARAQEVAAEAITFDVSQQTSSSQIMHAILAE